MGQLDEIFKAYDVRGIVPEQLDAEVACKVGKAVVAFLKPEKVVIGRDMRQSSEEFFQALAKGVIEMGADVIDIGLSSTDMFYYAVNKTKAKAGVMVTASHNPREYNGLKIVGEKVAPVGEDSGLLEIKKLVQENKFAKAREQGRIEKKEMLPGFAEMCRGFVDLGKIGKMKVVLDAGNGMAGLVAPKVLEGLQLEQERLFFDLDGSFPNHEANPLKPENRKDIEAKVKEAGADLGIAWDGDGDRCFFVNEKGEFVSSDRVGALIAKQMLGKEPGRAVLYDVRCSKYVPKVIEESRGKPVMIRVGHVFLKKGMKKENALFGLELSGHLYYNCEGAFYDNGFVSALKVLEILGESGKTFSELLADAGEFWHTEEINSEVQDKEGKMKELEEAYGKQAKKVFHIDGVSIELEGWWFNVRPSNTEPLLRLNLEANSKELMEEKTKEVLEIIRAK